MNRFIRLRLLAMLLCLPFLLIFISGCKKKMNPLSIPRSRFLFLKPPEKKLLAHRL